MIYGKCDSFSNGLTTSVAARNISSPFGWGFLGMYTSGRGRPSFTHLCFAAGDELYAMTISSTVASLHMSRFSIAATPKSWQISLISEADGQRLAISVSYRFFPKASHVTIHLADELVVVTARTGQVPPSVFGEDLPSIEPVLP